jgi:lipopolysaccharide export system permease protein
MDLQELVAEERRAEDQLAQRIEEGGDTALAQRQRMRVRMVWQERFATAFSTLGFALIAVPLGIKFRRKETSANLGVALVLSLGYYLLMIFIGWLDKQPELRPDLLLWLPNLLFQALGVWFLYKVE